MIRDAIKEAFLHCHGIGPARLKQLRAAGVRSWSDALGRPQCIPRGLRETVVEECRRCQDALGRRDIGYFVERLAPQDKWRVLAEFLDDASFFDIETTGLEYDATITVIVCWHRNQLHTFVEHENLDDFLTLVDDVQLLASFNGSTFDVPRVLDSFHIPGLPCPHLDLRWACLHRGHRGSLKAITRRLGLPRPVDLEHADGALAVRLWNRWMMDRDRSALDRLVRYCAADVLLLRGVAARLAGAALPDPDELWRELPGDSAADSPDAAALPPSALPATSLPTSPFGAPGPSRLRARRPRVAG